jgi:hypothetical protein
MMDLTINGQVITGTWTEETNSAGYYQGSTHHGAFQLLSDPTGRPPHRPVGRLRSRLDVNAGSWKLELLTTETSSAAMATYDRPPPPADSH